jgi:hypothetical protein
LFIIVAASLIGEFRESIPGYGLGGFGLAEAVLATWGAIGLILAILVIVGAILIYMPGKEVIGGVLVLVFSILTLFFTAGGLLIGLILGIIGGVLGITKVRLSLSSFFIFKESQISYRCNCIFV